jgi:25S rRNA (uracil2843-N3)-methyltransferase
MASLEIEGNGKQPRWKKILNDEARWFRKDKSLKYPVPLEDMRFQVHVFERV